MSLTAQAEKLTAFRDKLKDLRNAEVPVWEMERLHEFVAFAISKLSPFQTGDVAELATTPDIVESSGWYCHRHTLVAGKRGWVREIDWRDGQFVYMWEPEAQTWIGSVDGAEKPVVRPYHYVVSQAQLRASPPEPQPAHESDKDEAG